MRMLAGNPLAGKKFPVPNCTNPFRAELYRHPEVSRATMQGAIPLTGFVSRFLL